MTYSPGYPVPSALLSLTSLFGMGRGEPQRNNHHKSLSKGTLSGVEVRQIDVYHDIKKKENTV